ncbi:hypothetical protein [Myxosarcina sp. GI1(2024)]
MSEEIANQSSNNQNKDQTDSNNQPRIDRDKIVDPPELVNQPNFPENPEEVISNPAVAPQMLDDRRDLRGDLTKDRETKNPSE